MRIIHLRDSPFVGGPEKQILGQCARLDRRLYDPLVVSFADNALTQAARESDVPARVIPDGKAALPTAVAALGEILRERREAVVVSSGFKADFTAWLACRSERVPWIAWFHGYTGVTPRVRMYEAIDLRVLRRARAVLAVCETAAARLRKLGLANVAAVSNAVDADDIAARGDRKSARAELAISDDDLVIGAASRLSPEKGLEYLLDAVPAVLRRHPNARFVLIGDGPMGDALRHRCAVLGMPHRVTFAGFREDAAYLLKAFDVFVLPSLKENLPVALLEAMSCGVSVVATDVGGVREVLAPVGVEPIAPRSSRAIAAAITQLLEDPDARSTDSRRLPARAREFSFERQIEALMAVVGAQR